MTTKPLPSDTAGPNGEGRVINLTKYGRVCPGGELQKRNEIDRRGKTVGLKCKYCWNAREVRVRRDSVYQCSLCKVSLCVTCNHKYHVWLKFCKNN